MKEIVNFVLMKLDLYQVDAFANKIFEGKPELNALEIIEKINNEKKMNAKIDSIILNQNKLN